MIKKQKNSHLDNLFELISILNHLSDYDEILRVLTDRIAVIFQADAAFIMMLNPDTQKTVKTAMYRGSAANDKYIRNLKMQITGWMSNKRTSLLSHDIKADARFKNLNLGDLDIKSVMAGMLQMENEDIGSVIVYNSGKRNSFTTTSLSLLEKVNLVAAPHIRNLEQRRKYFKPQLPEISLRKKYQEVGLLGESKEFVELLHVIDAAARCDVRVVLEGQTGTGKELIARAIHKFSERRRQPFVAIDCGAIPAAMIESELFGYKRGAFTGAHQDRKGIMEEAHGGILFMDEIANLPNNVQSKFMRVLQEGVIRPLGSNLEKKIDVRIISASSQSLFKMVEQGKFREDLYFRLHVYPVPIPSLKERRQDIPLLAEYFLKSFSKVQNKHLKSISSDLQNNLKQLPWRGNIRELINYIERIVTVAPENAETLQVDHLPADLKKDFEKTVISQESFSTGRSLNDNLAHLEEQLIRQALEENDWNQSKAARVLDIAEHTIRYKMKKLGIEKL